MPRENTKEQFLSGAIGAVAGANILSDVSQKAFDEGRVAEGAAVMMVGAVAGAFVNVANTNKLYDKTLEDKRTGGHTNITGNYYISSLLGVKAGMQMMPQNPLVGAVIGTVANFAVNYNSEEKANKAGFAEAEQQRRALANNEQGYDRAR